MPGNSRTLALRVMLIYLVFAVAWILLSDETVSVLFPDAHLVTHFQTIKGLAFVGVTAVLLFVILIGPLQRRDSEMAMRIAAEDSLRVANERNEALLRAIPDMLFVISADGRFLDYCGPKGVTLLPPEHFIGKRVHEVLPQAIADTTLAKVKLVIENQGTEFHSYELVSNGEKRHFESRLAPCGSNSVIAICRDRTERHRVERALQESEDQLRKLFHAVEQSTSSIVITDPEGYIEYVNPRFTAVTGYTLEELIGKTPRVLKSGDKTPEDYRELWETITQGREWRGEFQNRRKNGEVYWEFASISPLTDEAGRITHFVGVKEDITGRKSLEDQLRHVQKMDAIGQLAGGVAHDFNNILGIIQMQADLLRLTSGLTAEQEQCAAEIEQATERAANLTSQLLLFSRRQAMRPRDLNLNDTVINISRMLARLLGENIRIRVTCADVPLTIHADPGMMDQVLLNLAVNSRDAMPSGGLLEIATSVVELDVRQAAKIANAKPIRYACLTVTDDGCGIKPDDLPRIFEPFFTTKDIGKGTGLGLATVFGIVEQHEGWIDVVSTPGSFTTFRIHFPLLDRPVGADPAESPPTASRGGSEMILVAEDDPALRALIRKVLVGLGYRFLEAASGVEAAKVWDSNRDSIDLLLTDLVMPDGMSGIELAATLRKVRPDLKVVFMSGYSPEIAVGECPAFDHVNFLAKPFRAHQLSAVVRAALDFVPQNGTADGLTPG